MWTWRRWSKIRLTKQGLCLRDALSTHHNQFTFVTKVPSNVQSYSINWSTLMTPSLLAARSTRSFPLQQVALMNFDCECSCSELLSFMALPTLLGWVARFDLIWPVALCRESDDEGAQFFWAGTPSARALCLCIRNCWSPENLWLSSGWEHDLWYKNTSLVSLPQAIRSPAPTLRPTKFLSFEWPSRILLGRVKKLSLG